MATKTKVEQSPGAPVCPNCSNETKKEFNFEPLRQVLSDRHNAEEIEEFLDKAMKMLVTIDQAWFARLDIINTYDTLQELRDAIKKGGTSCR